MLVLYMRTVMITVHPGFQFTTEAASIHVRPTTVILRTE